MKPDWHTMDDAPTDRPILVKFDNEAAPIPENGKKLGPYWCHADEGCLQGKGIAVVEWGGGQSGGGSYPDDEPAWSLPDWWFDVNSGFEVAVMPTHWAANVDLT